MVSRDSSADFLLLSDDNEALLLSWTPCPWPAENPEHRPIAVVTAYLSKFLSQSSQIFSLSKIPSFKATIQVRGGQCLDLYHGKNIKYTWQNTKYKIYLYSTWRERPKLCVACDDRFKGSADPDLSWQGDSILVSESCEPSITVQVGKIFSQVFPAEVDFNGFYFSGDSKSSPVGVGNQVALPISYLERELSLSPSDHFTRKGS